MRSWVIIQSGVVVVFGGRHKNSLDRVKICLQQFDVKGGDETFDRSVYEEGIYIRIIVIIIIITLRY